MSKVFTRRFRVRYSEVGADDWVRPSTYLRYLVETAYDWSGSNQLGMREIEELGLAWVIRETRLDIKRLLRYNEQVDFTIWLMEWRRVRGTRGFKLALAETGELVAQGAQKVVSLDSQSMRPVSPPESIMDRFRLENPPVIALHPFPNKLPMGIDVFEIQRRVEWRDLDNLDIVYNTVFVDYADEALRQMLAGHGWSQVQLKDQGLAIMIDKIHLKYLTPANWGEVLDFEIFPISLGSENSSATMLVKNHTTGHEVLKLVIEWKIVPLTNFT